MERLEKFELHAVMRRLALPLMMVTFLGCFFDSSMPGDGTDTGENEKNLVLLDQVPVTGQIDSVVRLYLPGWDPSLSGNSEAAQQYSAVKVRDHLTQKVVQYALTTQRFKSWNETQEFQWNLFRLRTSFFFPLSLPDTVGLGSNTRELYARVGQYDRFTRYIDAAGAAAEKQRLLTTRSAAMGMRLELDTLTGDTIVVRQAVVDAPAWRSGVRQGMRIVQVGDSSVVGDSALARFGAMTRGDSGAVIQLTVGQDGVWKTVTVIKEPVDFPSVLVDSVGGIPVVSLFVFADATYQGQTTASEFRKALQAIRQYPVFVFDLRQDPGGSLSQALQVADELLGADTLIIRQEQRFFSDKYRAPLFASSDQRATSGGVAENRKVVLLADSNTASASEIVIAGLRDGLNAPTVGTRTYGKGIGQIVMDTPGGGLALITHLHFVAPKGETYHQVGLKPRYPVDGSSSQMLAKAVAVAREWAGPALAKRAASAQADGRDLQRVEANRQEGLRLRQGVLELSL